MGRQSNVHATKKSGSKKRKQEDVLADGEGENLSTSISHFAAVMEQQQQVKQQQRQAKKLKQDKKDEATRRKSLSEQKNVEAQAKAKTSSAIKAMGEKIGRDHKAAGETMLDDVTNVSSILSKHFTGLEQEVQQAKHANNASQASLEKLQTQNSELRQMYDDEVQQHKEACAEDSKKRASIMGKTQKDIQKCVKGMADTFEKEIRAANMRAESAEQQTRQVMGFMMQQMADDTSSQGTDDDSSDDDDM